MSLYLDASALVKRYVGEPGSVEVRAAMAADAHWLTCRIAYVETLRAVTAMADAAVAGRFVSEWPAFSVVEVDQRLVERAGRLAVERRLCSLDALHLAAAASLSLGTPTFATWDRRLHAAARAEGLRVLPEELA